MCLCMRSIACKNRTHNQIFLQRTQSRQETTNAATVAQGVLMCSANQLLLSRHRGWWRLCSRPHMTECWAEQAMAMATWQLGERSQLGSISKRYWQAKERWRSLAMLHISDHITHLKDKRIWATVPQTVLMTINFQIPVAIYSRVLITKFEKDAGREIYYLTSDLQRNWASAATVKAGGIYGCPAPVRARTYLSCLLLQMERKPWK